MRKLIPWLVVPGLLGLLLAGILLWPAQPAAAAPGSATNRVQGRALVKALVAETKQQTGLSVRELLRELRDGNSLAEIAAANGSSADAVVSAIMQRVEERVNRALENGRITQEEANEILTQTEQRANELMNNTELGQQLPRRTR